MARPAKADIAPLGRDLYRPTTHRPCYQEGSPSMRYLRALALVFSLCTSGCLGRDALVNNQALNGAVDQVDGSSSETAVDNDASDGASPDASETTPDVAPDLVNPPDQVMVVDGSDVLGTDASDAPDVAMMADDASDAPAPGDTPDVPDVNDAPDVPDTPVVMPRCGDGVCTPASGEMCTSCPADCGSCPPVDAGSDTGPSDAGVDVPPDMGSTPMCGDGVCTPASGEMCTSCPADCGSCPPVDAGSDTGPGDAGSDSGTDVPTDSGVDVPTGCPTGLTYCGLFCRNLGTDTENCGGCGNRCPNPTNGVATCDGTCGFTCNAGFVRCGTGCVPTYPTIIDTFNGSIGAAMRHVDIRIAADATPITAYMSDACVGGLVTVSGGYRCQLDLARLLACRPWVTATYGRHYIFRDGSGNPIATSRTPGNPGATCYASLGSVPCIVTTCNGSVYTDPVYLNMDGSTVFYNAAVTPSCR